MKEKVLVITFPSTNYALKAEKLLQKLGLDAKCISSPRQITSDCGLALLARIEDEKIVREILTGRVEIEEFHVLTDI